MDCVEEWGGGPEAPMTVASTTTLATPASSALPWPRLAGTAALLLLLATHLVSFTNLLVDVRPSVALSLLMLMTSALLLPRLLAELSTRAGLIYALLFSWQVLTLLPHVLPLNFLSHWSSTALLANGLSYLLIPQALCFLLGAAAAREREDSERLLRGILWSHIVAVSVGIVFYLLRPAFVSAAEARVFGELSDRYFGFLPRMNGYFNSMVMGAACVSGIGLVASAGRRVWAGTAFVALFALGSLLTLQRSSWVLVVGTFLAWGAVGAARFLFTRKLGARPFTTLAIVAVIVVALIGAFAYAREQLWYDIAKQELENRFKFFDTIVDERRGQWDSALALVQNSPLGVGIGMASHKAAEVDGLQPFAIPDGNYFRYLAETGVPGIALLLLLLVRGAVRAVLARRWDIAVPMSLLLVAAVGTNILDLYYIGFVSWMLIGMANTATARSTPAHDLSNG